MIHIEKKVYDKIKTLGEGWFKCGWFGGIIVIVPFSDWTLITFFSRKSDVLATYTVELHGEYLQDFYQAESTWPIYDEIHQEKITEFLSKKILKAKPTSKAKPNKK